MEKEYLPNEIWKEYRDESWHPSYKYLISNYGRIKSLKVSKAFKGVVKGSSIKGYPTIYGVTEDRKTRNKYVHKIVAELFVANPENKKYVIHIDHDKKNNRAYNLRWADYKEKNAHVAEFNKTSNVKSYAKLTETQVMRLKRILLDPKRKTRYKILARQFGVSEMQLTRIKRGENWGHIKV